MAKNHQCHLHMKANLPNSASSIVISLYMSHIYIIYLFICLCRSPNMLHQKHPANWKAAFDLMLQPGFPSSQGLLRTWKPVCCGSTCLLHIRHRWCSEPEWAKTEKPWIIVTLFNQIISSFKQASLLTLVTKFYETAICSVTESPRFVLLLATLSLALHYVCSRKLSISWLLPWTSVTKTWPWRTATNEDVLFLFPLFWIGVYEMMHEKELILSKSFGWVCWSRDQKRAGYRNNQDVPFFASDIRISTQKKTCFKTFN